MTISLSPQQQAVVDHRGGHLQVIACAGSGKTESISRRMAALIQEGTPPEAIVAFTFTDKAAAEMKERVALRVAELLGSGFLDRLGPMFVGTIHSYCFRLLQTHVPRFGNFDILDEHRHAGFLGREYRRLDLKRFGTKQWQTIERFIRAADAVSNELIDVKTLEGTEIGDCLKEYLAALVRYRFLSFGQVIALAVSELDAAQTFRRAVAPLRYLFVDEYQDINPAQERLIASLAGAPLEVCVVGDDDQSIYQWRGSDVGNILGFERRYGGTAKIVLDANRRSRPGIVEAANGFVTSIAPRLPKKMVAEREAKPHDVIAFKAENPDDEAESVVRTIERLHEKGFAYREIAALFRSVRTSAVPFVKALEKQRIPYACVGRTGLFLQPEISLFAQIHIWFVDGDWSESPFEQPETVEVDDLVSGLEQHFPAKRTAKELKKYLEDWKKDRLKGTRSVSLVGDFYRLLRFLGAHEIDIETREGAARFGAFARFSEVLADFEHVTRRARFVEEGGKRIFRGGQDRGEYYAQHLANYLRHYARDKYEEFEGEPSADLDAVQILTIHQAKGLEWPIVFMPSLVSGRFPSRNTGKAQDWLLPKSVFPDKVRRRYEGSETDERRLFYVAMTRARDGLYLSWFDHIKNTMRPSLFLNEVAGKRFLSPRNLPLPDRSPGAPKDLALPTLSFSEVAAFDDCGYRYRLGTSLGFQQELAPELGYGKAIHHVLRQVAENAKETGKEPTPAEAKQLVDHEFYTPFANQPAYDRMHEAASRLVGAYLDQYRDDLRRVWATERPFELHLPDGILTGRADIILHSENGKPASLAIVDYKTATDSRRQEHFELQLAVYTAAGRGEGLNVEAAYLHELKAGVRRTVDISAARTTAAVKKVSALVREIRRGAFQPKPHDERCGVCDFKRLCRHSCAEGEVSS